MADIVAAFGVTHAVIMIRTWERASRAHRDAVRAGYDEVARRLRAAQPDVVLMVGGDHFQSFFLDNMPAFCLGVDGRCVGQGDGGLPRYDLAVHAALAHDLLTGLIDEGFDLAFARSLPADHAFMTPVHMIFPQADLPIVPLFQNCTAPPLPTVARCLALGGAIRRVLAGIEPDLRVALIGTGGLSHAVPLVDWRTLGDDPVGRDWLAFMSAGRQGVDPAVQQRLADEVLRWGREGLGRISEDFDRELLAWMRAGEYARLAGLDAATIGRRGGNGAQEIRNWATVMGAMPGTRAELLFYEAVPEWLTGVAGVAFQ
ncbi:DODA-type extradiol aromatic ring-opening family dioxygenase [Immundisolibacter sp.]